jgi:uncharacterized membrane protein
MKAKEFVGKLAHDRIVAAIREAESKTSAEIRVYIQRGDGDGDDPVAAAGRRFIKLGMDKTASRNSVLIYIVPRAHKFAVVGDTGIHEKCGESLWQAVVAKMRQHFQQERFTEALVDGINDLQNVLAEHFPRQKGDQNELPDAVVEG